ncbi:2-dehydro-3-deoxygalactonokinase [Rhodobacteraceae bacterium CCMM004]|nr:2-dehydro-3-deoxygalactonokinase [Rhodobacteraceae bacterium CCMM004]
MTRPDWIAVDWGTSNLRAWAMAADGTVLDRAASGDGMGGLSREGFEPALLRLIQPWLGDTAVTVLACGMVGARQGWAEAPYAAVPCAPLSGAPVRAPAADPRLAVWLLPGLRQDRPADVMRGEETQIAGFLATDPDFDGVLCLPGSHSKWVRISAGEVVSFQTVMTGELFAAISRHTVLRHTVGAEGWDDAAFADAVADTLSRPETLAARLFTLRGAGLLHGDAPESARARLSGLLIGAELAATRPYWLGQRIALIGATGLSRHYRAALAAQGVSADRADADAMTLAGLGAARTRHEEIAR